MLKNGPYTCVLALASATITLACGARAQRIAVDSAARALGGAPSRQVLVRTPGDTLYALSVRPNGQLRLRRRDLGASKFESLRHEIADAQSGVSDVRRTTDCSLAIDSKGVLHVLWARYYYPKFFEQFYRRIDPRSGARSPIIKTSHWKTGKCSRSAAMALAVDAFDRVYVAAPSARMWKTRILRIAADKTSADPQLQDLGHVEDSYSSQNLAMAIDAHGRLHCAYYSNGGGGVLHTKVLDGHQDGSKGKWARSHATKGKDKFVLTRSKFRCVFTPQICCDTNGGVHIAYVVRPSPQRSQVFVRKMQSDTRRWGPAQRVAQWSHPVRTYDPNSGFAFAVHPDGSGAFVARRLFETDGPKRRAGIAIQHLLPGAEQGEAGDPAPDAWRIVREERIEHRSIDPRYYRRLQARYALFPDCMRLHGQLDLAYAVTNADGAERFRLWRVALAK